MNSWKPSSSGPLRKLLQQHCSSTHCRSTTSVTTFDALYPFPPSLPFTMVMIASRAVFRQSAKFTSRVARRGESTQAKAQQAASKATEKTGEAASNFQSKASEGLSRAQATAGPAIAGAAKGVANALGKIGGRTGRFISFVESTLIHCNSRLRLGVTSGEYKRFNR